MAYDKKQIVSGDKIIQYINDMEDRTDDGFNTLIDVFYPIGTLYESTNMKNPSEFMGGTWEEYGKGRVTVGFDSSQTEFNTVDKTGGSKTHKLTNGELPSFDITTFAPRIPEFSFGAGGDRFSITSSGNGYPIGRYTSPGKDIAHNNLQPYITVYRFRRIA